MNLWKKLDKAVAVPLVMYIILLLFSGFFIIVAEYSLQKLPEKDIIANVGYGVMGSTVVAFLVDFAATKRKKDEDEKEYLFHTSRLRKAVDDLISLRTSTIKEIDEYAELPYVEWVAKISNATYEIEDKRSEYSELPTSEFPIIDLFQVYLSGINREADLLKEKNQLLVHNLYTPNTYFDNLEYLIFYTDLITKSDFMDPITFNRMIDFVLHCIVEIFPDYHDSFFEKWDSSKMNISSNACKLNLQIRTDNSK